MKAKLNHFSVWIFCAVAFGIGSSSFSPATAAEDSAGIAPAKTSEAIPWSQIGAKAGADYQGDGLAIIPSGEGARLRCVFQRLEGEATREGLWLISTVTNAVKERFCVTAAEVGRFGLRQSSGAFEADPKRQRTAAVQGAVALPRNGAVSIDGQTVRLIRPGLTEEYTVSMDGVRQDFIIEHPPLNPQLSTLNQRAGELVLRLTVSGAKVEPAADGARLVLEKSGRKIAYSRLRVTDATGKELPARMELQSSADFQVCCIAGFQTRAPLEFARPADLEIGDTAGLETCATSEPPPLQRGPALAVVVNDADAVYPVRIDPTFSDTNWMSMGGFPGANGVVYAAVVDGSGNLYIGGSFSIVGDVVANCIAKWNGSAWTRLSSGLSGAGDHTAVYALAVSGSDVYAAGIFTTAGGSAATNIAKWNGSAWSALGLGLGGAYVSALAVSGSDLYAGGAFTTAGGSAANFIAKWTGSGWSPLGSGMNAAVRALVVSGSDVYAGGDFTTAGDSGADNIAKWNGSAWSPLGLGIYGRVWALAVSGSNLYAGGFFATAGGNSANYIAKWNGSAWSALGSGLGGRNPFVFALAVSGSNVYAGGEFTTAGGKVSASIARYLLPLPTLSVFRSGPDVTVSWPSVDTAGFTLEQAGAVAAPASWVANASSITDDGTNKSVTLPATNSAQVFRLRRP
ncbi:MAG: hypothetical protein DME22_04955 [Verrucomicrobia bacterium]|nr:MAG: hypothetical protein DME22_04955 [Verrucomicrobiota bacterium]